jgi:hypothetical protein
MARTKWVDHRGKKIFFVDFAKTDAAGVKEAIEEAKPVISRQAERSLPYMNVTAIIGIAGITKVVLNTAIAFTKRDNLIVKNSLEEALDFLAAKG